VRKRTSNKLIRGEKGQALILVLILMLLGGLIIAPLLSYMSTGLKVGKEVYENRMAELYAADAGVENALYFMKNNRNLLPTNPATPVTVPTADVNSRTLDVNIYATTDPNVYKVTSTATSANDKSTTIVAYVQFPPGLFDNALTAMGDENQENGTIKTAGGGSGNIDAIPSDPNRVVIFANGSVSLPQSNVIGRIIYTSGTVTVLSATSITLEAPFNFGPLIQTLQTQIVDPAKAAAQNVTPPADFPINPVPGYWTIEAGTWKIKAAGTYSGDNHVGPGDCEISAPAGNNTITMEGTLIVDGKLTAGGYFDLIFNGPVYVKGGPSHDQTTTINAWNFNGIPHTTTFNDDVYIDGNLKLGGKTNPCTMTFNGDVYISGYLDTLPMSQGLQINFNGNVYVGAAHGFSSGYCLRFENGNVKFGGIVYVNDPRGQGTSYTTFYCGAPLAVTGGGPIIIKNSMTLTGGSAELDDIPLIMSEFGTIWSPAGPAIVSYLYAPYGLVKWGGAGTPGTVTGGITAKTIQIAGGVEVVHAILPVPSAGSGNPIILSWETNVSVAEE
jgi:hypothetical protein